VNLSDRVRANVLFFLEAKSWTYNDLGREFDRPLDRRYVGHMLRGDKGFSASRIDDFAAAFGVDVSELCVMRPEFKEARAK
jgi:hypothetical protein